MRRVATRSAGSSHVGVGRRSDRLAEFVGCFRQQFLDLTGVALQLGGTGGQQDSALGFARCNRQLRHGERQDALLDHFALLAELRLDLGQRRRSGPLNFGAVSLQLAAAG